MSPLEIAIDAAPAAGTCRRQTTLAFYGPSCSDEDARMMQRTLVRLEGVTRAAVHSATEAAYVEYCPRVCKVDDLILALRQIGIQAHEQDLHYHG